MPVPQGSYSFKAKRLVFPIYGRLIVLQFPWLISCWSEAVPCPLWEILPEAVNQGDTGQVGLAKRAEWTSVCVAGWVPSDRQVFRASLPFVIDCNRPSLNCPFFTFPACPWNPPQTPDPTRQQLAAICLS